MPATPSTDARPTLVYDGDCGICKRWVAYWEGLTGPQIGYRPYQEAARDFPGIPLESFERSIQLIEPDGAVHAGAAATFRVLSRVPGRRAWWWLYEHIPGFAPASEWSYAFFARRRGLLSALTTLLWGRRLVPERYERVTGVFIRGLALVYFAAFTSLAAQILGLVGSRGMLPIAPLVSLAREQVGFAAVFDMPTLFWLDASDTVLFSGTIAGMALAVIAAMRKLERTVLTALFVLYLSYVHAGQEFMMFQWDLLLGGSWTDPWFSGLLRRLLEGSPDVLALMQVNPFPERPPKLVRAVIFDYRFADADTHGATGQWWVRRKTGDFSPALRLADLK